MIERRLRCAGAIRQFQFHECTDLRIGVNIRRIAVWTIGAAMR